MKRSYLFSLRSISVFLLLSLIWTCHANAATAVKLTWGAPVIPTGQTFKGYNVYRSTTPGGEGAVVYASVVGGTTLSFIDTGVVIGTQYYYKMTTTVTCDPLVFTCPAVLEGPMSVEFSAGVTTAPPGPLPGAPVNPSATIISQ